jgi:hypothetical protein
MSELNYPFVNVPPIVYNQDLAKSKVVPDTVEAYDNSSVNAYTPSVNNSSITFLPLKGNQMSAIQGEYFHPDSHILTPTETFRPRRSVSSGKSVCDPKKHDCSKEKVLIPAKSTALYVAALGSVGLIILAGFISKSQY